MRILALNYYDCHHEMFGHIIDFCKTFNYTLDIRTSPEDYSLLLWYTTFFKYDADYRLVGGFNYNKEDNSVRSLDGFKYDYLIFINDTDYYIQNTDIKNFLYTNSLCIDHSYLFRNPTFLNHVSTRFFKKRETDFIVPCYKIISKNVKENILNRQECINIALISNFMVFDYDKTYQMLHEIRKDKIHIYHISRIFKAPDEDIKKFKDNKPKYVTQYLDCDSFILDHVMRKCHYVYIPHYKNKNYKEDTSSGAIQLAFNYMCQLIFPFPGYNKSYKLYSPLELNLNNDQNNNYGNYGNYNYIIKNFDLDAVDRERDLLIQHRNKIFNDYLYKKVNIPKRLTIKHKIPKKIFQTWERELHLLVYTLTNHLKKINHNYEYYFFTSQDRLQFIKKHFDTRILNVYNRIIPGAFKADFWRYCVLYIYGGIYCDIDMVCLNTFDHVIKNNVEGFAPILLNPNERDGKYILINAFIGMIPKHPIMKICIDKIVDNVENDTWWNGERKPLDFTGPGVLGHAFNIFFGEKENNSLLNYLGIKNNFRFLEFTSIYEPNTSLKYSGDLGKEFIKTKEGEYIMQNKNGNYNLKFMYEKLMEKNNIKPWTYWFVNRKKPYI